MGWLGVQRDIQHFAGHAVPLEGAALSEYVRWNALALIKEVAEALDHVSWKMWTTGVSFLDRDDYLDELADVQIFLGNMLVAVGEDTEDFARRVSEKQEIVRERFASKRYEQRRVGQ